MASTTRFPAHGFATTSALHESTVKLVDGETETMAEEEAGLSLLLAASLLRQSDHAPLHTAASSSGSTSASTSQSSSPLSIEEILDSTITAASLANGTMTMGPKLSRVAEPLGRMQQLCTASSLGDSHLQQCMHQTQPQPALRGATTTSTSMIQPTNNDVLCGRGGGINKHYGNIMYRRVVEYNKKVYKQVPKRHRMLVSRSIVQAILNAGGRFLQEHSSNTTAVAASIGTANDSTNHDSATTSEWTEIQFRRAVQKTSQALRERSED